MGRKFTKPLISAVHFRHNFGINLIIETSDCTVGLQIMKDISLDDATKLVETAKNKADEIEVPMCIAVMDAGANLVAFERMDDALLASIDIAQNKAFTSVTLKLDTQTVHEVSQPGESLYGIGGTNSGRIVTFGGGFPLTDGDRVVGAIGVSGGSVEEDIEVAQAAIDRFAEL